MITKTKSGWIRAAVTKVFVLLCVLSMLLSPLGSFPALAIDSPILTAPADGATVQATVDTPLAIPIFEWEPVTGATKYRLEISNTIGFSTVAVPVVTEFTRYAPTTSSLTKGDWYWRVRVEAPTVGAYSSIWRFTRDWASSATQPVLLFPVANQAVDFYNTFSWTPVLGAANYKFEISSSDTAFDTNIKYNNSNTAVANTQHQPKDKLANGTYYWRVTPLDPAGGTGMPSEIRPFNSQYSTAPTLLEPTNNFYPTFTPNFRWTAVKGAQRYRLQYATSSDFSTGLTTIETENTSYTPVSALPNDVNFYWHVQVISGASLTPWSNTFTFQKRWYLKPTLLTPSDGFQYVRFPFFSWTPVAGASYYKIEFDDDPGFGTPKETGTTSNLFYTPIQYESVLPGGELYYWRVTPYDKNNNPSKSSNPFSFRSSGYNNSPELIYPYYYYPVQPYLNPQEDRTAALPLFLWHRLYSAVDGTIWAAQYTVTVGTDPNFNTIKWEASTENLGAAPTVSNPFVPVVGLDYYWKVTPANEYNQPMNYASQVWKARFDSSLWVNSGSATLAANPPELLRPRHGLELIEMTPVLEWKPVDTASTYQVQVSRDAAFTQIALFDEVPYPVYAPTTALAQRNLADRLGYGTFYWRVLALSSGVPLSGGWSTPYRFQVASQGTWKFSRSLGDLANRLQVGSDPALDVAAGSDLTTLNISQDKDYWYVGFPVNATTTNSDFLLLMDLDHVDGSGAPSDPVGAGITTINAHQPEYAIHLDQTNQEYTPENTKIYAWDAAGGIYLPYQTLSSVGGDLYTPDLYGVAYDSATTAWAVGQDGTIMYWNGSAWTEASRPSTATLLAVDALSPSFVWAVGNAGTLLKWNGSAWEKKTSPTTKNLWNVHFVSETNGWASASTGSLLYWNGITWTLKNVTGAGDIYAVDMITSTANSANNFGLAVGSLGTWLKWNPTTKLWENQVTFTSKNLYDVSIVSDTLAWAVGQDGVIFQWDGATWSNPRNPVPAEPDLNALTMLSDSDGLAVGNNGVLLRWDGGTWTSVSSGTLLDLYNLDFNPGGTAALLVGESGKNMLWNTSTASALQSAIAGYLELKLPNTSIGMGPSTGSMSVALVSLNGTTPVDTVPSNTNPAQLANFTSASERMNVRNPPDSVITGNTPADPRSFASIPPYFYDYPVLSEWGGNNIETHEDAGFTTPKASASSTYTGKPAYYAQSQKAWGIDLADGPYFWRVRQRYYVANVYYTGVWSQGSSYKRIGLVPTHLSTSVSFATPTFTWDRVEGAALYLFTLSEYADFSNPLKNAIQTSENQYTPDITLKDGIPYYWKVSIQRYQNINNLQYASGTFTLTLPTPTGLHHVPPVLPPSYFPNAPALCWDPLILPDTGGQLTFAAWKYRVEINTVASFDLATRFDWVDTEQQCWTSSKNFPDDDYFWRVALIDGEGKLGPWSSTAQFTKQYPAPTLLSPTSGGSSATTPMFEWTPVDGAASYVLQVAYDDKFSNMAFGAVTTAHVNYMPLTKLKADTLYFWRVAIKDKVGNQGPFNDATILVGTHKYKVYIPLVKR